MFIPGTPFVWKNYDIMDIDSLFSYTTFTNKF